MLTEARVHDLADALTQAGESITLARIREANGHTGSLATISRYLVTWREGRRVSLEAEARRDPAIDAIERLAPGTYQKVVQKAEEESRAKFEALREQLASQETDRANLVAALALAEDRSAELTDLVTTANKNREQIISALSVVGDLTMQIMALQDALVLVSQTLSHCNIKIDENRISVQAEINRQCDQLQSEFDAQLASLSHEIEGRMTQVHEGITQIQSQSIKSFEEVSRILVNQFKSMADKVSGIEIIARREARASERIARKAVVKSQNIRFEKNQRLRTGESLRSKKS